MLPPPKSLLVPVSSVSVKDAARAVRRVSNLEIHSVSSQSMTELLGLSCMQVTHFAIETQDDEKYLHLFCEHEYKIAICPHCNTVSSSFHGYKDRCVRHLDMWNMKTLIHFPQRRFYCEICANPFTEQLSWIESKRRTTTIYEEYIYNRVQKTPRKHVALQEGLSESTVLDIFKKWAKRAISNRHSLVRVLGIDEISLRKGHKQYALVLSDLTRRCVIAVLPNRKKEMFEKWLSNLNEEERRAIKVVSMDMWNPYRQAVRNKLPHADIVADRFHVMKQLNHQIDLLRRSLQKNADKTLASALKGSRWILLKNRNKLTQEKEAQLTVVLSASDELRDIYLLKEKFRVICDKIHSKSRAERFLSAWTLKAVACDSRYLIKFVSTLRNWWHEFLNYFDDGVTQGFVEGINRAIRGIINRAFGFLCFDNFRLQVLVECRET